MWNQLNSNNVSSPKFGESFKNLSDNNHEAKKSKRVKSDFPFGKCKICNDESTGIHYGVATCDGCKGFFKRTILREEMYDCSFENNCQISPTTRNKCKSCRFRKCLEYKMSISRVKMGRIPKLEKEIAKGKILRNNHSETFLPSSDEEIIEVENNSIACSSYSSKKLLNVNFLNETSLENVIEQVYDCYMVQSCKFLNQIEQANILASLNCQALEGNEASLKDVWNGIIQLTQINVKCMVQLIRKIPGVGEISDEEFAILCNQHLMDFYLMFYSQLYINGQSFVLLPNGIFYTRQWAELIAGKEVIDSIFDFCEKFNQLQLIDCEKALLFALIITNDVEDEKYKELHEFYLKALMHVMRQNKRDNDFIKNLTEVLGFLSKIDMLYEKKIKKIIPACIKTESI